MDFHQLIADNGASFYLIAFVWTYAYVGQPLMGSFSFLAFGHSTVLGGGWAFRGVQSFFLIPSLNVVLAILIFLGFLGPISQSMFNTTLASSRIYLSQSFDRVLPAWMGQVNKRGAPANAIWFGTGISIVLSVLFLFRPSLTEALTRLSPADAAREVAGALGLPRRELYRQALGLRGR